MPAFVRFVVQPSIAVKFAAVRFRKLGHGFIPRHKTLSLIIGICPVTQIGILSAAHPHETYKACNLIPAGYSIDRQPLFPKEHRRKLYRARSFFCDINLRHNSLASGDNT